MNGNKTQKFNKEKAIIDDLEIVLGIEQNYWYCHTQVFSKFIPN